ncbi:MAG: ROK family protein [Burkholderiaceae bacterium]
MRLGIDLGGTKIEIIALDDDGKPMLRHRVPTPRGDYLATVQAVGGLVESAERSLGRRGTVGVGMPGALSRVNGRVKNANSVFLNGRPLKQDLERRLDREVRVMNDANCFALSEAVDGSAVGAGTVFGIILGTGVGAGIVVRRQVLDGANAIAGEWGHNALPMPLDDERPGPACYCGRSGCIETWLSGPGFVLDYQRAGGPSLTAVEIVSRARRGESLAGGCLDRYVDRLARSLAMVINIVDPDVVVFGGGMSHVHELHQRMPGSIQSYVFSDRIDTRFVPNMHGDSSGVRGAAWLWPGAHAADQAAG